MIRSKNTCDACDAKNVSESSCEIELNGQSSQILFVRNEPLLSLEKLRIRRDGTNFYHLTSNHFLVSLLPPFLPLINLIMKSSLLKNVIDYFSSNRYCFG